MINCIIIDDEAPALNLLEDYVRTIPQLKLLQKCNNAFEATRCLRETDVQLMFLDIQMPKMNGLELMQSLTTVPLTIITTAYDQYAVQGFELDVVDYLLKPFSLGRFTKAVNKAFRQMNLSSTVEPTIMEQFDYMFLKSSTKLIKVNFDDILYIEAMDDFIRVVTYNQRMMAHYTMKRMMEDLPLDNFLRVHRSYIVAIDKIRAIEGHQLIIGERKIPVTKTARVELFERINLKAK